jgi:transcriptional regulator with XRE-family HTH domain
VLGETLRKRRLQRGLDLADAAAELGLPAKSLRALEWDRPDLIEGEADDVERRYAGFLGLEVELPATVAPAAPPAAPRQRRAVWLPLLAALAPVAVIGAVYVLSRTDDGESASEEDRQPQASSIASTPDPGVTVTSEATPAPTPAPARRRVNLVLMADRGGSWVEAHSDSADGPLLFQGTLEEGRELHFAARRIWLRLGAASNVSLVLNGRSTPRELFGTVDVLVTPQGIRAAG